MVKKLMSLVLLTAMVAGLLPFAAAEGAAKSEKPYFPEGLEFTWMRPETSQQTMAVDAPVIKYLKEELNVTINLQPIPEADYETKRATVLASNSMPDVVDRVSTAELAKYASMGMFYCIDDHKELMPNYYALVTAEDRSIENNKFRVDGKMYSFRILEKNRIAVAPAGVIRADLLEEQNIPMPTTWKEMYDAMLKIKAAHPEMYAFSQRQSSGGTNYLIGQLGYPMGSGGFPTFSKTRGMYYEPRVDKFVYGPTDPNFKIVVEFLANAYRDGLLDPDYAATTQAITFEKLSNNKLFYHYDNNSHAARVFNPALREINENYRFELVPPLENDLGETRALRYERDWAQHLVISSRSKNADKIMQVIDWLYSEEGMLLSNFGKEGIDYDMVDGKPIIQQWLIDETATANDHFMGIQGALGVGLHGMGRYIDEHTYTQVTDPMFIAMGEKLDEYTEKGQLQFLPNWPPFTSEEVERITDLEMNIGNMFDQEIDKFITGKRPMSDWEQLVSSLKTQGTEELEQLFNTAYDRVR